MNALRERIIELEGIHGGLRPAARALLMDQAYLARLRDGEKTNPSKKTLAKLKLKKVVNYVAA